MTRAMLGCGVCREARSGKAGVRRCVKSEMSLARPAFDLLPRLTFPRTQIPHPPSTARAACALTCIPYPTSPPSVAERPEMCPQNWWYVDILLSCESPFHRASCPGRVDHRHRVQDVSLCACHMAPRAYSHAEVSNLHRAVAWCPSAEWFRISTCLTWKPSTGRDYHNHRRMTSPRPGTSTAQIHVRSPTCFSRT